MVVSVAAEAPTEGEGFDGACRKTAAIGESVVSIGGRNRDAT